MRGRQETVAPVAIPVREEIPRRSLFHVLVLATLSLPASLRGQEVPSLSRGPYITELTESAVRVVWNTTSEFTDTLRLLPLDGGSPLRLSDEGPTSLHALRIEGLTPATEYQYEIWRGDAIVVGGDTFRFRTSAPAGTGTVRAVVIGDSGDLDVNGENLQRGVTALLERLDPELFLHTGDLLYNGSIDEVVFEEYASLFRRIGFAPSRGNHRLIPIGEWFDLFWPPPISGSLPPVTLPEDVCPLGLLDARFLPNPREGAFYSFDRGPVHITCLDFHSQANVTSCGPQLQWLVDDLRAADSRGMPWKVLVFHDPVYAVGPNGPRPGHENNLSDMRARVPPIAEEHGVDLILNGHDHLYSASYPIREGRTVSAWQDPVFDSPDAPVYVVTGGGGTRLYPVLSNALDHTLMRHAESVHHAVVFDASPERLEVSAVRTDDTEIDRFVLTKAPRPEAGFQRGDVAADGNVDLADAVETLAVLFAGTPPACPQAFSFVADVNGDGAVEIADAIGLLGWLFLGGPPPVAPFPKCAPIDGVDAEHCLETSCRL